LGCLGPSPVFQPFPEPDRVTGGIGVDPGDGFLLFQSLNREEAQILGLELRSHIDLAWIRESLAGSGLNAVLAFADGKILLATNR
jgi:hypothetical protein